MPKSLRARIVLFAVLFSLLGLGGIPLVMRLVDDFLVESFREQANAQNQRVITVGIDNIKEGIVSWMRPWFRDIANLEPLLGETVDVEAWTDSVLGIGNMIYSRFGARRIITYSAGPSMEPVHDHAISSDATTFTSEASGLADLLSMARENEAIATGQARSDTDEVHLAVVVPTFNHDDEVSHYHALLLSMQPIIDEFAVLTGYPTLLDVDGHGIESKAYRPVLEKIGGNDPFAGIVAVDGIDYLSNVKQLNRDIFNADSKLITFMDVTQVTDHLRAIRNALYFTLGSILFLGAAFLFVFLTIQLDPLKQIADITTYIAKGHYDLRVPTYKSFEMNRVGVSFNEMVSRIMDQHELEKRVMNQELEAAREIQNRLFPKVLKAPGLSIAQAYIPAGHTGGDWFGYNYDDGSDVAYIYMGDVTGHGIASALVTGVVHGAVHAIQDVVKSGDGGSKGVEFKLQLMASSLNKVIMQSGSSDMLMTMAFIGINVKTGEGTFLNAGHTFPLFIRGENGTVRPMLARGDILGFSGTAKFKTSAFSMDVGDRIFLFTDGLIENEGPDSRTLKPKQISKIIQSSSADIGDFHALILEHGRGIWQETKARDDITLLTIERNAA